MNEMKQCPSCGGMMKNDAVKCRLCGRMITGDDPNNDPNAPASFSQPLFSPGREPGPAEEPEPLFDSQEPDSFEEPLYVPRKPQAIPPAPNQQPIVVVVQPRQMKRSTMILIASGIFAVWAFYRCIVFYDCMKGGRETPLKTFFRALTEKGYMREVGFMDYVSDFFTFRFHFLPPFPQCTVLLFILSFVLLIIGAKLRADEQEASAANLNVLGGQIDPFAIPSTAQPGQKHLSTSTRALLILVFGFVAIILATIVIKVLMAKFG